MSNNCLFGIMYNWGVSRKLATFAKMTVTGMYIRKLIFECVIIVLSIYV